MIKFAENFAEVYPKNLDDNLALLTKEERDAIAEDVRRWRLAGEIYKPVADSKAKGVAAVRSAENKVRHFLSTLEPEQYKEDMRRRLNYLRAKAK